MLKSSLLAAAAAFAIMAAATADSRAQDLGTRQIVVDPSASPCDAGGGGKDCGAGAAAPVAAAPAAPGSAASGSADAAGGGATPTPPAIAPAPPAPSAAAAGGAAANASAGPATPPANPAADALGALIGKPVESGSAAIDSAPSDKGPAAAAQAASAAPAAAAPPIKNVDGLIGALQTNGFNVDIDHRDQKGDYYLVVTTPKDQSFGYLLTVDDTGRVLVKEKIDPTDYGYYNSKPDSGDDNGYGQSGNAYGGSKSYGGNSSYGGNNSYGGDNSGGGSYGGGNGYGSGGSKY